MYISTTIDLSNKHFSLNCFHLGNIALNHFTRDAKLSRKSGKEKSLTTDGILEGGKCFLRTDKDSFWWVKFGSKVRVAMVFLMHSEDLYSTKNGIQIKVGSGKCFRPCANDELLMCRI